MILKNSKPASMAQLDAHRTGDQEVAGSITPGPATFFPGDFLWWFSPFS